MTAPIYLVANPALRGRRQRHRWDRWLAELAELLPGQQLVCWDDLPSQFRHLRATERPGRLAGVLSGAIVIPDPRGPKAARQRFVGLLARAEADAFAAAGKPVFVYAAGVLTPWTDCELREADPWQGRQQLEALIPEPTSARSARR